VLHDFDLDLTDLVTSSALSDIYSAKILIVSGDPFNSIPLREIMEKEGYKNLFSTNDFFQVLSLNRKNRFDLILLDIDVPEKPGVSGISGMNVLQQLQKDAKGGFLPVIVLSVHAESKTRKKTQGMGAKDFIAKPYEDWEVLLRIQNILQASLFHKQQASRKDLLESEIRKRTKEILSTQFEIVQRLAVAGELRDNETGAHVKRMSHICSILSLQRGLGQDFSELILYASAMHDVGKIGVPDSILLKSKPLTPEEWLIMQQHPIIGARIIGDHDSQLISLAREIALYHHEKWDGSGYPHGISGNEIPISARIAAISDVFDALTSDRPYKQAWPLEKVTETIQKESGHHFEPIMVELFLENLPEIMKIKERYIDHEFYLS